MGERETQREDAQMSLVSFLLRALISPWRSTLMILSKHKCRVHKCKFECAFNLWSGMMPWRKNMATHSRILAWEIPRTEEPGRTTSPWGHKESDRTERLIENNRVRASTCEFRETQTFNL